MAAELSATISASVNWTYTNAATGLNATSQQSSFTYSKSITNGTGAAGTANLIYAVQTTLAGDATTTLDLAGSLSDWFGTTITMARVKLLFVHLTTDTTATHCILGNGAAPMVNWISTGTATVTVRNGGLFMLCDTGATAYALTATSADDFKIENEDASNTATLQICIIGSSA